MATIDNTLDAAQQRSLALQKANARRLHIAAYRRALRTGQLPLESVMRDQPAPLAGELLVDVVRMAYTNRASTTGLERLGADAVSAGVNLMVPLGRASARSRAWVARNLRCWHPSTK